MPEPRRGLFLQGGGALGAWQAGALEVLDREGWRFQAVMGYSIGAVNGSALAFGRLPEALRRWRAAHGGMLRLSPRLRPFGLFSPAPLLEFFSEAADEEAAKRELRAELTVVSASPHDGCPINARFTPGGREWWDGPLVEHVLASCAIPAIFPPVAAEYQGRRLQLIDGGVPMDCGLDFTPLSLCGELLVLEMVRADELGRSEWLPWRRLDQRAREAGRGLVDGALEGLARMARPPRVERLAPSRRLEPMMLDFRAAGISDMLALGARDARAFLERRGR